MWCLITIPFIKRYAQSWKKKEKDEYGFYEDYPDTVKNVFYGDKEEYGEPLWTLSGDGITVYFNTYVLAPLRQESRP